MTLKKHVLVFPKLLDRTMLFPILNDPLDRIPYPQTNFLELKSAGFSLDYGVQSSLVL